jgi:hypothetical protein
MSHKLIRQSWQTDEMYEEACKWLDSRPKAIQEAYYKYLNPPHKCWRLIGNRGHYGLYSISEPDPPNYPEVTVTMVHLEDSYLPDTGVFGILPRNVIPCGCLDNESDE